MSTDRQRHVRLAIETGTWTSWVSGQWFTDLHVAIKAPAPFAHEMRLELACGCPEDAFDMAHALNLKRPCVFVDWYEFDDQATGPFARLLAAITASEPIAAEPGGVARHPERGDDYRRIAAPDGRWVGVQERWFDAARRIAGIERWELRQAPPVRRTGSTLILVGLRGDEVAALIMPLEIAGSEASTERFAPEATAAAGVLEAS